MNGSVQTLGPAWQQRAASGDGRHEPGSFERWDSLSFDQDLAPDINSVLGSLPDDTAKQAAPPCTGPRPTHCASQHCANHLMASMSGAATHFMPQAAPSGSVQLPRRPYFPSAQQHTAALPRSGPNSNQSHDSASAAPNDEHLCDEDERALGQINDPEKYKLEKRRAKNRRTARISRERKQAEVAQLKAELDAHAAEVARLREIIVMKDKQLQMQDNQISMKEQLIRMKDQHIRAMTCVPSTSRGGMQVGRDQSEQWGTSHESAELKCDVLVSNLQLQRHAPRLTAPLCCLMMCGRPSLRDDKKLSSRSSTAAFGPVKVLSACGVVIPISERASFGHVTGLLQGAASKVSLSVAVSSRSGMRSVIERVVFISIPCRFLLQLHTSIPKHHW